MAFDYLPYVRDPLYPVGGNRDERILIEYNGILHSEAEDIFYGMKDCPVLEAHPFNTYQRILQYDQEKIYEEIGYFRPRDLIRYLNDGNEIDEDEINFIIEYSLMNYDYKEATILNMMGAFAELIKADYVKGITIVLTNHRETDKMFLADLLDNSILNEKASLLETTPDRVIEKMEEEALEAAHDNNPYTTIITNEYQLILDILERYKAYKAETTLFLLRNHSQNMEQSIKGDSVHFLELHTKEIVGAINGDVSKSKLENLDFPVKAKFGRFSPTPFKTDSPTFMTFGDSLEETPEIP